jgi:hypothetical protein
MKRKQIKMVGKVGKLEKKRILMQNNKEQELKQRKSEIKEDEYITDEWDAQN